MNILFVTDSPFYPVRGGADRVVYEQAVRLKRHGHDVAVVCRDKTSSFNQKSIVEGVRSYYVGAKSVSGTPAILQLYSQSRSLIRHLVKKYEWDLVFFHQPLLALFNGNLFDKKTTAKIYWFHSPLSLEYALRHPGSPLLRWCRDRLLRGLEWMAVRQADMVFYDSKYMENCAAKVHPKIAGKPHKILPPGVDLQKFACKTSTAPARARLKLWPDAPLAFTVRNLEPRMGLPGLLEAWKQVLLKEPRATLVIGGEGSLKPVLKEKIERWKLQGNVKLTGFIPEEELSSYYQAADFFILPTQELEGFGLVTLEALASGTPVLATHVGGIPEVLEAFDSSLLFSSRRSHILGERILQFIDRKEWEKFPPARCRKYAETHFAWDNHIDQLEKLIQEAVRFKRRGP